jgi:hypothetical protein
MILMDPGPVRILPDPDPQHWRWGEDPPAPVSFLHIFYCGVFVYIFIYFIMLQAVLGTKDDEDDNVGLTSGGRRVSI